MNPRSSNPAPFQRFESEYLACWEAAQEAKAKLTPSSAESALRLMCIALLQHFERFCIEQTTEIATLRPKLVKNIKPARVHVTGEAINLSFRKLVQGDLLSRREVGQLQKIVRIASVGISQIDAAKPHADWTARLDTLFDLAVKIARSTGSAVAQDRNPEFRGRRKIAANVARLLRARYDSLA